MQQTTSSATMRAKERAPASAAAEVLESVQLEAGARALLVAKRLGIAVYAAPRSERWGELGETRLVDGEQRIYVRDELLASDRADELQHVVAHEVGHWVCRRWRLVCSDEERWCNAFARALTGIDGGTLPWLVANGRG